MATLDSVQQQKEVTVEHILIDGGSIDGTWELINDYKDKLASRDKSKILVVYRQESTGVYAAMNQAISKSNGTHICFLNADDVFANDQVCRKAFAALNDNASHVDAVFGDVRIMNKNGGCRRYISSRWWQPAWLKFGFMPPQPGFFVKRSALILVGDFLPSMQIASDFEWMIRFFYLHKLRAKFVPEICVNMMTGGLSMRGIQSSNIIHREMSKALKMHSLGYYSFFLFIRYPFKLWGIIRAYWR
ncbi:MAG: hypothetical protein RL092_1509 [Bacteroidota bacterium]